MFSHLFKTWVQWVVFEILSYLQVVLLREIEDDEAEELVEKCPVKVFDIEDIGKGKRSICFHINRQWTITTSIFILD